MERVNVFDRYLYLAQEIHNIPICNSITRINHLLTKICCSNPQMREALAQMIDRYHTALTQTISLTLSRNIQQDPATMVSMWTQYSTDETAMLNSVLDLSNFHNLCSAPLSDLKWSVYGLYIPKQIQDFWCIVTGIQFLLPVIAAAEKRYLEVYGKLLSFSIMLCIVKNFLRDLYPEGWKYIEEKIYHTAAGKDKWAQFVSNVENFEEFLAQVILSGLADLELDGTKYINMYDIEGVLDYVLSKFLIPKTVNLPPHIESKK